jgi:hypothetical protein
VRASKRVPEFFGIGKTLEDPSPIVERTRIHGKHVSGAIAVASTASRGDPDINTAPCY